MTTAANHPVTVTAERTVTLDRPDLLNRLRPLFGRGRLTYQTHLVAEVMALVPVDQADALAVEIDLDGRRPTLTLRHPPGVPVLVQRVTLRERGTSGRFFPARLVTVETPTEDPEAVLARAADKLDGLVASLGGPSDLGDLAPGGHLQRRGEVQAAVFGSVFHDLDDLMKPGADVALIAHCMKAKLDVLASAAWDAADDLHSLEAVLEKSYGGPSRKRLLNRARSNLRFITDRVPVARKTKGV